MARAKPAKDEPVEAALMPLAMEAAFSVQLGAGFGYDARSINMKTGVVTQVTTVEGQ